MSYFKIFSIALLTAMLAGCPQNTVPDPDPDGTVYDGGDVSTGGVDDGSGRYDSDSIEDPFAGELGMVIYFEYDSSDVRAQDQDLVARHALELANNSGRRVRLAGHADERGSREYNIGLGERRAQAVRQILMIQGVSAAQIQTVSFGEERPESFGSSESDYAQNRRVEFVY
jgi:peptidoglycan-associated lipoprotein